MYHKKKILKKKTKTISIVITNYNNGKYLARAVRSCISQFVSQKQIEVIVVDDGSTDNSIEVLNEFDSYVNLIINKNNMGVSYSSNLGLKYSTGDYWMRVDSDDYLSIHACETMSCILDYNEDISYVYSDHYRIDSKGNREERIRLDSKEKLYEHGAGILMRTDMLRRVEGYDESLKNCEDYDLLLRIYDAGYRGFYFPVPLYRYYIHGSNITLRHDRISFRKVVEKKHGI